MKAASDLMERGKGGLANEWGVYMCLKYLLPENAVQDFRGRHWRILSGPEISHRGYTHMPRGLPGE